MKIEKKYIVPLIASFILLWSCASDGKDELVSPIDPKLSVSAEQIEVGQDIELKLIDITEKDIQSVKWDLGDGTYSEKKDITHHYDLPGTYAVTVNTTLVTGGTWSAKTLVDVYYPEVIEGQRPTILSSLQKKDLVQICAHRGYWKDAPENSIRAINLAIEKKIEMIELDVRTSKDGELVLMHDATINRTTNGTGEVSKLDLKELLSFSLYHNGELTEEKIPLFKNALALARGKIYIDIDVKASDYKVIYDLVRQYGMLKQVLFTVYDVAVAKKIVGWNKEVIILPVIYEMKDLDTYLGISKPLPLAQFNSTAFTDEILAKAASNNVAVFKNIYVNTNITPTSDNYKQVRTFLNKKGSIIQTDYPAELIEYLKNNK